MSGFNGRLRLLEFNVENLFLYLDHHRGEDLAKLTESGWQALTSSTTANKPIKQIRRLAAAIRDINPDIMIFCEVGGRESLANFNRYFLKDLYQSHLLEGNSDRGIDLGYLVRKTLPFKYDLISHRHRPIDFLYPHELLTKETGYDHLRAGRIKSHRFSRDVLELRVFEGDEVTPVMIILQVHLKSQLDPLRIDPQGRDRRRAEAEKLVKIQQEISQEFNGKVPVLLAGDFNGGAWRQQTDVEFESIYRETDLEDCLQLAGVPEDERFTHMQISSRRVAQSKQLDYIFVPKSLASRVNKNETWVYRYKDELGMTLIIPRNIHEKRELPSDHYPVVLTLNPYSVNSQTE